MQTIDLLVMDTRKEEKKKIFIKALKKIKPVERLSGDKEITIEVLEKSLVGICTKYGYITHGIYPEIIKGKFFFFSASIIDKRGDNKWVGTVNGGSIWEVLGKMLILIYSDIKKKEKEGNS